MIYTLPTLYRRESTGTVAVDLLWASWKEHTTHIYRLQCSMTCGSDSRIVLGMGAVLLSWLDVG